MGEEVVGIPTGFGDFLREPLGERIGFTEIGFEDVEQEPVEQEPVEQEPVEPADDEVLPEVSKGLGDVAHDRPPAQREVNQSYATSPI